MRRRDLFIGVLAAAVALVVPVSAGASPEANPGDDVPIKVFEQRDETRFGTWVGAASEICVIADKPSRYARRTFVLDSGGVAGREVAAARMRAAVREALRERRAVVLSDEDVERLSVLRYDAR